MTDDGNAELLVKAVISIVIIGAAVAEPTPIGETLAVPAVAALWGVNPVPGGGGSGA